MLFNPRHVVHIVQGTKVATRRRWKRWHVKKDGVYPVQTRMFQNKEDCPAFIKCTRRYKQRLGDMTVADMKKEGGYNLLQFVRVWKDINDTWDDDEIVYVVEFELYDVNYDVYHSLRLEDINGGVR